MGRQALLVRLTGEYDLVKDTGDGRMITIRGRRQVGKTWLVEELLEQIKPPHLFFPASAQTEERELNLFGRALAASNLPSRNLPIGTRFETWQAALTAAATGADRANPSVIVLDEFPYLLGETQRSRKAVLGSVQSAWDRTLSKLPVLLILVGSDLSMMEQITAHGNPLYQRPSREMDVRPLNPAEAAELSGLRGADALDSYLVTGGFPKIVRARGGMGLRAFLSEQLTDAGLPLVLTGRQVLDAEFPPNQQARAILSVIGEGFRRRVDIGNEVGVASNNLAGPLETLTTRKRVVEGRLPLSTATSRDTRYEIVDPYLRFFMRFIDRHLGEIERGRGRIAVAAIMGDWSTYRGKAIEHLVRDAVDQLLPDARFGDAVATGGFWTTDHRTEIDLIGADRRKAPARRISFIGTVKWRENKPLTFTDLNVLTTGSSKVPGMTADTRKVGASRSGVDARAGGAFDVVLEPDELLEAWKSSPD
ncbi:MAG: ATP-binding protein [Chloroflexota bacterium]